MPPNLNTVLNELGTRRVSDPVEEFKNIGFDISKLDHPPRLESSSVDTSDLEVQIVKEWLHNIPHENGCDVFAFWPASGTGGYLKFEDFVERYDDLWYPAMDDVVAVTLGNPETILVMDHEEKFTYSNTRALKFK
jgi:hypothetical protein